MKTSVYSCSLYRDGASLEVSMGESPVTILLDVEPHKSLEAHAVDVLPSPPPPARGGVVGVCLQWMGRMTACDALEFPGKAQLKK